FSRDWSSDVCSSDLGIFVADVARGDLGRSITQRQPVRVLIGQRLVATAELALAAMFIALLVGITLGVLAAVNRGWLDYLITTVSLLGVSAPVFYLGLLLIMLFSVQLAAIGTAS